MARSQLEYALESMRSILDDLISDSFKEEMASGPINGFVDMNELYQIYMDSYYALSRLDIAADAQTSASLNTLKDSLHSLVVLADQGLNHSQIIASPAWSSVQEGALVALRALQKCSS